MLSVQEMSDRLEIQDLLARYCHLIDTRDWDGLDDIFTADAVIDYTEAGGEAGNLTEIKAFLGSALSKFSGFQHMIGLPLITLGGDTATARTILYNPMIMQENNQPKVFFVGLWYRDELKRTDAGWRISSRYEEISYFKDLPQSLNPSV